MTAKRERNSIGHNLHDEKGGYALEKETFSSATVGTLQKVYMATAGRTTGTYAVAVQYRACNGSRPNGVLDRHMIFPLGQLASTQRNHGLPTSSAQRLRYASIRPADSR